jgi:hypothetical protein
VISPAPWALLVLKVVLATGGAFSLWAFTYMGWRDRNEGAGAYFLPAFFGSVYLFGLYGMMWW